MVFHAIIAPGSDEMIGAIIRHMRISCGMEQKDLSKKINKAISTISSYETGEIMPSFDTVLKIANVCEFTIKFEDDNSGEIIICRKKG